MLNLDLGVAQDCLQTWMVNWWTVFEVNASGCGVPVNDQAGIGLLHDHLEFICVLIASGFL